MGRRTLSGNYEKLVEVSQRKMCISYVSQTNLDLPPTMSTLSCSARNVSIVFSANDLLVNTNDHFHGLFQ